MPTADFAEQIALAVDIGGSKVEITVIDAFGQVPPPTRPAWLIV